MYLSVPTADHHSARYDQRGRRLDHAAAGPDANSTAGPAAAAGAGAGGAGQHAAHDYYPIEHGGGGVATAAAPAAATNPGPTQAGSDPAAAFGHLHHQRWTGTAGKSECGAPAYRAGAGASSAAAATTAAASYATAIAAGTPATWTLSIGNNIAHISLKLDFNPVLWFLLERTRAQGARNVPQGKSRLAT